MGFQEKKSSGERWLARQPSREKHRKVLSLESVSWISSSVEG